MIEFLQPQPEDIDELVANMRRLDVEECEAAGAGDLRWAVAEGVEHSPLCWTIKVDGKLAAIVGVRPYGSLVAAVGVVWLLGTPVLTKHHRALVRYVPGYIQRMLQAYPRLVNFVHVENKPAVRFLRHAGFLLHEPQRMPSGAMFHPFEMRAQNV